jgi:GNAT superfamily N-acetyltransferase
MNIKKADKEEILQLMPIYKAAYPEHNIFKQSDKEIEKYLLATEERDKKNNGGYIVAKEGSEVVGGLLLSKTASGKNKHSIWKYRHVAVAKSHSGKGIGNAMIKEADSTIKRLIRQGKIKTARVEVTVAQCKNPADKFYLKNGFKLESKSKNYYRWNETTHTFVKFFS